LFWLAELGTARMHLEKGIDAPPISRADHHRAGGRTPRAPAITSPASGSNRGGRERAKRGAATHAACQSPSAPSVGRSRNLRSLGSVGGRR
jgi:hypothetical protein